MGASLRSIAQISILACIVGACIVYVSNGLLLAAHKRTLKEQDEQLLHGITHRSLAEQQDGFSQSFHNCTSEESVYHSVCYFNDLYLFNGILYYVVPEDRVDQFRVPKLSLRFMLLDVTGNLSDWLSDEMMKPISSLQLHALASSAPQQTMEQVAFWSTWITPNYYHMFAEYMPSLHVTICKYLGKCAFNSRESIQLIDLLTLPAPLNWPPWFHEALGCFTTAPYLHLKSPQLVGQLVHIRHALMGVGSSCRARHLCAGRLSVSTTDRKRIEQKQMRLWRERLGSCLGFDTNARARTSRPRIMLVNRPAQQSRHLINVDQLGAELRQVYSGFAEVAVQYMEGMTLRQQAQLWSGVSVVVFMHGAALSNCFFLPRGSVVVHIVMRPQPGHIHDVLFAKNMELDVRGVTGTTFINLINPSMHNVQLQMEKLEADPTWQRLTDRAKSAVITQGNCDRVPPKQQIYSCERGWLTLSANLALPPTLLLTATNQALAKLYRAADRPLPPTLAAALGTPAPEGLAALATAAGQPWPALQ